MGCRIQILNGHAEEQDPPFCTEAGPSSVVAAPGHIGLFGATTLALGSEVG
jgi:hypothetical protein